jgi:cation diffusion facilitator family transporter
MLTYLRDYADMWALMAVEHPWAGPDHHHSHHGHSHGLTDPSIIRSQAGVRAVSASLAVLLGSALIQLIVFLFSGSVALLTDVIHNGGDALTAIPLGIAFIVQSRRGERWAGYCVVAAIFASAVVALTQVIERLLHPETPTHLWSLMVAGAVGIAGNELAARIRWRAGRRLESPALVADGNHARADGYVSAGVIVSTAFIALGAPIADPIIGLLIAVLILRTTWQSWVTIKRG